MALLPLLLTLACQGAPENYDYIAPSGTWRFSVDNDTFARSDQDYTSGVQIGWISGYLDSYSEAPGPDWLGRWLDGLSSFRKDDQHRFLSYSLSHRVFTASDTSLPDPPRNDLPYSAILYFKSTAGAQTATTMDALSLTVGLVGPLAMGEEIQSGFHHVFGSNEPQGWDHQLHNEPLLNVEYERRHRLGSFGSRSQWGGDWLGSASGSVGNLLTMGTLGATLRVGWRVPDDFAMPPPFFGEESIGSRPYTPDRSLEPRWSAYFFAHTNASVYANAIYWDGNTFEDSRRVDYEPHIGRLYAGVVLARGHLGLSLGLARTTIPWDHPDDRDYQSYGRIAISWTY